MTVRGLGIFALLCLCQSSRLHAANCLLRTGFDPGICLHLKTNTGTGYISGRDSVSGYSLTNLHAVPSFAGAELGALGSIPEFITFGITNLGGAQGNALSMQCFKTVPGAEHNTRASYTLNFREDVRFSQAYVRYRMKLHGALRQAIRDARGWLQVFESKDYRLRGPDGSIDRREKIHTLHVNVKRSGESYYYSLGWRTIGPARQIWELENRDVPVKFGEWFTVELFLRPGPPGNGRFVYRIDGKTVFSVTDREIQYKDSPLHTLQIFKIYMAKSIIDWMRENGTPCQAWFDDLEYWDDMPAKD